MLRQVPSSIFIDIFEIRRGSNDIGREGGETRKSAAAAYPIRRAISIEMELGTTKIYIIYYYIRLRCKYCRECERERSGRVVYIYIYIGKHEKFPRGKLPEGTAKE